MQIIAQIKNKKWFVSTTLLLATFFIVFFTAFSPVTTPKAHAGYVEDKITDAAYGAAEVILKGIGKAADAVVGKLFEILAKEIVFPLTTLFFSVSVWFLDTSIAMSLNSSLITSLTTINDGWSIVRDVCNMFFIFSLLYIAIATILQAASFNWKKTLGNLIIAALLINFSLFFTKVIIDVSNMFAVTFYNGMQTDVDGTTVYGPSMIIRDNLRLETTIDSMNGKDAAGVETASLGENLNRSIIWLFASVFQMVAGFVFLAGSFIFIKRTIVFIFLLILSPVGFLGFILPATKKYSDMWWKSLTENAIIAPVFLFMLYLVCGIAKSGALTQMASSDKTSLALALSGDPAHFAVIMHFVILIGLMWGALSVAQQVSSATGNSAISFAGKMTGGMVGATAIAGRQSLGRAGRVISESDHIKRWAESDNTKGRKLGFGRMLLQGGDAASKSSWDARNGKIGNAAIGGTLNTVSSIGGTGKIDAGIGQNRGKGGVIAATEAREKIRQERDANETRMLAKDKYGKVRMVTDKKTGETIAARELQARNLERRANRFEPKDGDNAFSRSAKATGRYLNRDDSATDKESAKSARKGDKDSKEGIRKEEISVIENNLKNAIAEQSLDKIEKIMGDLNSDHIKDMDMKVLIKPEVAMHLDTSGLKAIQKKATINERQQIRTALEEAANWQGRSSSSVPSRTLKWLNGASGSGGEEF